FASHRHLFSIANRTRDEYLADFRDLFAIGVHTATLRIDHLRASERALVADGLWSGRREDGDFEVPMILVLAHDGRLFHAFDVYDADQLAAAQARCAGLSRTPAEPASPRIGNLATRAEQAACDAFAARDWDRLVALFAPDFRSSDRRRLMHLELNREQLL